MKIKTKREKTPGEIMAELLTKQAKTGKTDSKLKDAFRDSTVKFFESHGCKVTVH